MDENIKFECHSVPIGNNIGTFFEKNIKMTLKFVLWGVFMGVPWGGIEIVFT